NSPWMKRPNSSRSSPLGKLVRHSRPMRRCAFAAISGRISRWLWRAVRGGTAKAGGTGHTRAAATPSGMGLRVGAPRSPARPPAHAGLIAADFQRLVAQAVSFVQQQKAFLLQLASRHDRAVAQLVTWWAGEAERLHEEWHAAVAVALFGEREQQDIERVRV